MSLTTCLIVDQKLGVLDALTASWDAVTPHWWAMFGMLLLLSLIRPLGLLGFGVGILITAPLHTLTVAVIYRELFPEQFVVVPIDPPDDLLYKPPPKPEVGERWLP